MTELNCRRNLYTQNPPWLRRAKAKVSAAVMDAYKRTTGDERWQYGIPDDELLDILLNLQKERAEKNGVSNYMGHMWN